MRSPLGMPRNAQPGVNRGSRPQVGRSAPAVAVAVDVDAAGGRADRVAGGGKEDAAEDDAQRQPHDPVGDETMTLVVVRSAVFVFEVERIVRRAAPLSSFFDNR